MGRPAEGPGRVVALVAAHREAALVGDTVRSLRRLAGLDEVVVVDDGSDDGTAAAALGAGATVLRVPRRVGKGRALEGALRRLPPADVWLFADADLGATAERLAPVLREVVSGRADLAIAVLPPQPGGGFGIVRRFASGAIRALGGLEVRAPLSGQRAITGRALSACRPLAPGFGLETAMTIAAARRGFRVVEVPVDGLRHRPTGRGLRGFAHRGRQGIDVAAAALRVLLREGRRRGAR
ncbi:MAG TPA: glycosyltransferase [Actinomycetota bacterium]|nr:glycosyltransferase [Actinomycetota bacterium]